MYSLRDICMVNFALIYHNFVMVNKFNSFYLSAKRLNRKSIEVKKNFNLIDITAELYSTAIEVVNLQTNMK